MEYVNREFDVVKRLIVTTVRNPEAPRHQARTRSVRLSARETKDIMLRRLVEEQKFEMLAQMYPEELYQLSALIQRYQAQASASQPQSPRPAELNK